MSELKFFKRPEGLTIGEIAVLTGAEVRDQTRLHDVITNVAPLNLAVSSDLAFLDTPKYVEDLNSTQAGACLMSERFEGQAPNGLNVLRIQEPYRAFVVVARKLFEEALRPLPLFETDGVAPTAAVHPSARIDIGATIDPGAVIGPRAVIGSGTVVGANAVVGADVHIGRDCSVGPAASIIHAIIGNGVILHPGCRIGQDGFRFLPGAKGHLKVPQLGRVIIHDNVEIGAGAAIDRGGGGDTVIGEGTKIDNLVHVAHNVTIGRYCLIAGQCGIAGSTTLGNHVVLGGQVGIADHLSIGDGAMIGAKSGVMTNVPAGEKWFGFPARPHREFLRATAKLRSLIQPAK